MEIAFVLDDSLDKPDGVQQYILTLGAWLAEQDHQVHYLVGETSRQDIANVHSVSRNVPVRFNHNHMSIPLPVRRAAVRDILESHHFDVLHVQMPYSPMFGAKVIENAPEDAAVVGTFHIAPYSKKEQLASSVLARWVRSSLKRFDAIISASTAAQKFAKERFKIESTVVPNVVERRMYTNAKGFDKYDDGKTNVVFLGRLVPRKGCEYLLKAVHNLQQKYALDNYRVIICGQGPLLPVLKRYAHDNGLDGIVEFTGFVEEADKPSYYASADIAVFPSTGGESFGIVLIEAMSAGAGVVIGGDNPGYRTVLGTNPETLFSPSDTAAFATLLKSLMDNPHKRQTLHRRQQTEVIQYDVSVVGPKIVSIYKQAIEKRQQSKDN